MNNAATEICPYHYPRPVIIGLDAIIQWNMTGLDLIIQWKLEGLGSVVGQIWGVGQVGANRWRDWRRHKGQ